MTIDYTQTMYKMNYWKWKGHKVPELFDSVVDHHPSKVAIHVDTKAITFHMMQIYSYQVSNFFYNLGLQKGDVVGILGVKPTRTPGIVLGLSRMRVTSFLVPTNLTPDEMVKAITYLFSKAVICDASMVKVLREGNLPEDIDIFVVGSTSKEKNVINLDPELQKADKEPLIVKHKGNMDDKLLYLLPDYAKRPIAVTNYRYAFLATSIHEFLDLNKKDVIYSPIPMHETASSILAVGQALLYGNTIILRETFSAEDYFLECMEFDATVAQYNKDIITKLAAQPSTPTDQEHSVRLMFGEGLRNANDWINFKQRFHIKRLGEYYGTVESDKINMVNSNDQPGSVGFYPWLSFPLYQIKLISYNPQTGDPIRDGNGLCIPSSIGKPGILIDEIPRGIHVEEDLKKTVIRDVYKKGDKYINTGDILRKDVRGYYFVADTVQNIKSKQDIGSPSGENRVSPPSETSNLNQNPPNYGNGQI